MSGKYLLDTNIIIALFADEGKIRDRFAVADETFVSAVALGELYYGAYKSSKAETNLALIEDFAMNTSVISCDAETAKVYGDIKNTLRLRGQPIPENDIWIAAIALQYHLTLVTRDVHFDRIDHLNTELW